MDGEGAAVAANLRRGCHLQLPETHTHTHLQQSHIHTYTHVPTWVTRLGSYSFSVVTASKSRCIIASMPFLDACAKAATHAHGEHRPWQARPAEVSPLPRGHLHCVLGLQEHSSSPSCLSICCVHGSSTHTHTLQGVALRFRVGVHAVDRDGMGTFLNMHVCLCARTPLVLR